MSERKNTPNILAEILDGDTAFENKKATSKNTSARDVPSTKEAKKVSDRKPHDSKKTQPTVSKLEYQIVSFQEKGGWRPRFINGKAVQNWEGGPLIFEFLEQTADEGWELISSCSGKPLFGTSDSYQLYFSRKT